MDRILQIVSRCWELNERRLKPAAADAELSDLAEDQPPGGRSPLHPSERGIEPWPESWTSGSRSFVPRRNNTIRKMEAELAEMHAELEQQMTAFRKEVAAEANRIGGVMQVTGRRVVAAESRQAWHKADLNILGEGNGRLLRKHSRLGLDLLLGNVLLGGTLIFLALWGPPFYPN